MRTGPNPGKVFELSKNELYIGRDVNNDIVINDSEISRKHARILMQAGGFVLEDLGSTNGSFINGQRLMGPHVLRPGETVMLGENVSLLFEAGFDSDATVVSTPVQPPTYSAPVQRETFIPPPVQEPTPAYSGQIPAGPAEPYFEPGIEPKKSNRNLLIAGCGCLLILLCVLVVAGVVFDTMNMYCTPPFNTLFACP
jgi:pSer/pThr/pTyr-binding forkhead associated (FHA) protein